MIFTQLFQLGVGYPLNDKISCVKQYTSKAKAAKCIAQINKSKIHYFPLIQGKIIPSKITRHDFSSEKKAVIYD